MKCRNCGHTEVGMYKEIRGIISEMGITKEDVRRELKNTIDSMVNSALGDSVNGYIQSAIKDKIDRYSFYSSEAQSAIRQATREAIADKLESVISVSVKLKESEDKQC